MIALALIIAGTALRVSCYRHMRTQFTFQLAILDGHKLVTDGPYAYVRHPSYTGVICVVIASTVFNLGRGSWWVECAIQNGLHWRLLGILHVVWSIAFVYVVVARCKVEDKVLKEHFGKDWVQWAKQVPYRVIPYLF